jgi:hypothetical protein
MCSGFIVHGNAKAPRAITEAILARRAAIVS